MPTFLALIAKISLTWCLSDFPVCTHGLSNATGLKFSSRIAIQSDYVILPTSGVMQWLPFQYLTFIACFEIM